MLPSGRPRWLDVSGTGTLGTAGLASDVELKGNTEDGLIVSRIAKLVVLMMVVAAVAVGVIGCGGEETTDEARQQLMTDLQAFEATVQSMGTLTATSSVDEWEAARQDAQEAWEKVVVSAADVKEAEVGQVQTAWDELAKSVDDLGGDTPLTDALPTLTEEINAVKAAYQDLYNGLQ